MLYCYNYSLQSEEGGGYILPLSGQSGPEVWHFLEASFLGIRGENQWHTTGMSHQD